MSSAGIRVGKQTHSRRNEVESRSVQETHEVIEQYRERRKGVNTINRTAKCRTPLGRETQADEQYRDNIGELVKVHCGCIIAGCPMLS